MDIEELNRTQIILLVLLVSFVTSIATGIVTVTLLAQAPPTVTQTINRIVERTVETVVADPNSSGTTVVKETTTVVKEEDLLTESIAKTSNRMVRIHAGKATTTPVAAVGIIVSADGTVATDWLTVEKDATYAAQFPGNKVISLSVSSFDAKTGIALLVPVAKEGEALSGLSPVSLKGSSSLKLGQTVLAVSGTSRTSVSTGIVETLLDGVVIRESVPVPFISSSVSGVSVPGTPLVNIFGEVIGISTSLSRKENASAFVSSDGLIELLRPAVLGTSTPATN
jgi:S1-C subfamily serine protease